MEGLSLNIQLDQLEKLKHLFPETLTEGKIDWEKLQATLGKENFVFQNERYVLNWAGKAEAFKVLQQSTTATLKPVPEESINFETTENVFIEGENLEVLKVLQKAYYNKIKCIIIDPPYNTGNDSFIYPDSFKENKEEYLKRIGEKDEEGFLMKEGFFRKNSRDSGHYHSNWLSMMYPRMFLAKNLLRDDGVIFVHIDDNEVHNLRLLMNEILGEENFIACFIWKRRQNVDSRSKNGASVDHEYILCFRKSDKGLIRGAEKDLEKYSNPDNDPKGNWMSADMTGLATIDQRPNLHYDLENPKTGITYKCPPTGWRYEPRRMNEFIKKDEIIFPSKLEGRPRRKKFQMDLESDYTGFSTILDTVFNTQGTRELRTIFDDKEFFDFPKPKDLLKILIEQGADQNNDIILDFFCGSGTTAQAVLEINKEVGGNRKFILVQLPEPCDESSEAFISGYKTIADISKERIRRVIQRLNQDLPDSKIPVIEGHEAQQKLFTPVENPVNQINPANPNADKGFKVFKLSPSNFKIWRGSEITEENLEQQLEMFTDPVREGSEKENMLYELILKAGYLLTDKVEAKGSYYSINEGELVIALEEVNQQLIETIISAKPKKVITLDRLFADNDQLKTNAVLQMKDAGVDFKTI
ncbi:MAG: site-specific DNA-methyltransferase [Prolixibacteraceae bacterium]|jgi:adenine-specific DNA-methyltransferase|nr:site-specific DNA-methyltransferase [Prolixibacteraceae bacterium]